MTSEGKLGTGLGTEVRTGPETRDQRAGTRDQGLGTGRDTSKVETMDLETGDWREDWGLERGLGTGNQEIGDQRVETRS